MISRRWSARRVRTDLTLPSNLPVSLPSEVVRSKPAPRWRVPSRFLALRLRLGLVGVGRTRQIFDLAGGHPANVGIELPSG
jgi:hypothetical protein